MRCGSVFARERGGTHRARRLRARGAPVDSPGSLTSQQLNGLTVFQGPANCALCHALPETTDNSFRHIGLVDPAIDMDDLRIIKAAYDMHNEINVVNVVEKLVAAALTT